MSENQTNTPPPTMAPMQISAAAIWSMITGVFGISPVSIILGIVSLVKIKRSSGKLTGGWMAIVGIMLSLLWITVSVIILMFFIPVLQLGNAQLAEISNLSKARQTLNLCRTYASENGGAFPQSLDDITEGKGFLYRHRDGTEEPFIYLPGANQADADNKIVILSPFALNGKRIAGYANGDIYMIPENEIP